MDQSLKSGPSPTWANLHQSLYSELFREDCLTSRHVKDSATFRKALDSLCEAYEGSGARRLVKQLTPCYTHLENITGAITVCAQSEEPSSLMWSSLYVTIALITESRDPHDRLMKLTAFYRSLPMRNATMQDLQQFENNHSLLQDIYTSHGAFCIDNIKLIRRSGSKASVSALYFIGLPAFLLAYWKIEVSSNAFSAILGIIAILCLIYALVRISPFSRRVFPDEIPAPRIGLPFRHNLRKNVLDQVDGEIASSQKDKVENYSADSVQSNSLANRFEPPSHTIPYGRNPSYQYGAHFQELHRVMHEPRPKDVSSPRNVLLHGMGGIGKTQTALEYAFKNEAEFRYIFWVASDTESELRRTYSLIGDADGVELRGRGSQQDKILRWLKTTNLPWLIIFDNVESFNDIAQYWPNTSTDECSIIVTTQKPELGFEWFDCSIAIRSYNDSNGADWLMTLLKLPNPTPEDREAAMEFSRQVGGLPFAIAVIAGSISQSPLSISGAMEIFCSQPSFVWETQLSDTPYRKGKQLSAVWDFALSELSDDARDLAHILAYLSSDSVSESILIADDDASSSDDCRPGFLFPSARAKYISAARSLRARSLVQHEGKGRSGYYLSMHRSLQQGILHKMRGDPDLRKKAFQQAYTIVRRKTPESSPIQVPILETSHMQQYTQALPHILYLRAGFLSACTPSLEGSEDFVQLLYDAGITLWWQGITKDGLKLLQTAESILDQLPYNEHGRLRADICVIIGIFDDMCGISRKVDSLQRREKVRDIRRRNVVRKEVSKQKVTRNDEILRCNADSDLGCSLLQWNQWRNAGDLFSACLKKYEEWDTPQAIPFEYGKYYNNTAFVRMYEGHVEDAIELATSAVKVMSLTPERAVSSQTLRYRYNLACFMLQAGQLSRALDFHQQVLQDRQQHLGSSNTQTLASLYAVGAMHHHLDDLVKAEAHIRRCLEINEAHSAEWPTEYVIRAKYHLSQIWGKLGTRNAEAKVFERDSWNTLEELIRIDYPDCLQNVDDKMVLFDHLIPALGGRFTGLKLLDRLRKLPQEDIVKDINI